MSKKGIYKRRFLWYIICENNEIGDADMEEKDIKDIELFNEKTLKTYTDLAKREEIREKNSLCITYLVYLLTREDNDGTKEQRQRIYNSLASDNVGEKSEYQKALDFFRKKQSIFTKSQFTKALNNLFDLSKKKPGEEHALYARYFNAKSDTIEYSKIKEPNIVELAKQFNNAKDEADFFVVDAKAATAINNTVDAARQWEQDRKSEKNL